MWYCKTAQQMMYAFHGPFIYYNRICIGLKNTEIKTQMYQLMLALFGRLIYYYVDVSRNKNATAATNSVQSGCAVFQTVRSCGRLLVRPCIATPLL